MSAPVFEAAALAAVLGAAAFVGARRSIRAGLALLALYAVQGACAIWISRSLADGPRATAARLALLAALVGVLAHRLATYAFSRPPAARDRLIVPVVHVAQAWLFLELAAWPFRVLMLPDGPAVDALAVWGALAFSAIGLMWTHRRPVTTRIHASVRALGRPLRVVHLSDLHLGPYLSEDRLSWLVEAVQSERPDLIALTGDFLTLRTLHDWDPVLRFVERLQAPDGVFACLGNHDVPVADALSRTLRARGVTVLRDEVTWVGAGHARIAVAGLDWRSGPGAPQAYGKALARLCQAAGPAGPAIVLCHQPAVFRLAPRAFGGIMLAGHLHGGQVGLRWRGRGVSVLRLFGLYDQGLFARGAAWLYSHRGTGVYGFPIRVGVPAEIAVLDLAPAGAEGRPPAPLLASGTNGAAGW
ncbi:MAG: metallophosphoesterase [Vicinamibacterales bacterium]